MHRTSISISAVLGVVLAAALWWLWASPSAELVEDEADLMSAEQRARVAEFHDYLLKDHDIDYRIVTARDVGDINDRAVERFEGLAATIRSKTGRGLLLMIDAGQDLVRLEIGYALEGVFPDAFAAYVEHRQMVPFFERGRVADGILATTELIITRAQRAAKNAGFDGEAWTVGSGGAGATAPARLGQGPRAAAVDPQPLEHLAGRTPAETLQAYFDAMAARNDNPDLDIYTPATRRMLQEWVMTPAQMDNIARTYRGCRTDALRVSDDGRHAVIRYPANERACAPFFFQRADDGWALDLTMMQRAIRFGRNNAWRFDLAAEHPYMFAFKDWRFDRHGFPRMAN